MANISGYLNNIKAAERGEDVRDSIINALEAINRDNPSVIKPLNVTSNGTYAGEGGIVYNPITVNVPEGAASALTLKDINITENGETEADDGEAFRSVTVDVPQYVNEILDEITITANGEYDALLDGYDGYGKVTVNVQQGGTGTFSVTFYAADRTTVLQKVVNVPAGGGAVYQGPNPTSSGMRFVGWTPNPLAIYADTKCYPRFENLVYSDEQILDDWVTIAKNVRANPDYYAIGQWKLMEFSSFIRQPGNSYWIMEGQFIRFMLAGKGVDPLEGENGYAPTTWVAKDLWLFQNKAGTVINFRINTNLSHGPITYSTTETWDVPANYAYNHYDVITTSLVHDSFPQELYPYLRRTIKYTEMMDSNGTTFINYPIVAEGLFSLSLRELGVTQAAYGVETLGPVYLPDTTNDDRKCASFNNQTFYRPYMVRSLGTDNLSLPYCYINNDGSVITRNITSCGATRLGFCL